MKAENADKIKEAIVPEWSFLHNYASHHLGRIWVCWNPGVVNLRVVQNSTQVISCDVFEINGNLQWVHSFIYGANEGVDRRDLWQKLNMVKNKIGSSPWILSGDFNVVCSSQEKWGQCLLDGYESDFVDCIYQVEIVDLAFSGSYYTWTNKQSDSDFVAKKLDLC